MGDEIPQWAKERACELALKEDWPNPTSDAFARYIAKVAETAAAALRIEHHDNCTSPAGYPEQCACGVGGVRKPLQELLAPEPVDPLLVEARKLAADIAMQRGANRDVVDHYETASESDPEIQRVIIVLRRGMELAREQSK